jgi:hypothetical protein
MKTKSSRHGEDDTEKRVANQQSQSRLKKEDIEREYDVERCGQSNHEE